MKRLITIIISLLLCIGCGTIKPVPVETIYNIKDSTAIHYVDSTVIVPVERIKDVVPQYDTLTMETSMAKSVSYVDTLTHTLKGTLENKKGVEYKYIFKDRIEYKDSIITKEVPVPVEVEKTVYKHYWYETMLWLLASVGVIMIVIKVIRKKFL